jgi:hypothetical protein
MSILTATRPTAVAAVTVDHLIRKHRSTGEIVTAAVEINPFWAQELLSINKSNRSVSWATVDRFVDDMRAGRWSLNGEAIVVSDDGRLNTGQHRCLACVKAGVSFWTMVTVGIPYDARHTDGQGLQKTTAHRLAMRGHEHGDLIGKAASMLLALNQGAINHGPRARSLWAEHKPPSHLEIVAYAEERKDDLLRAAKLYRSVRAFDRRRMAALAVYLQDKGARWIDIEVFFNGMLTGANLDINSPIYTLRRRLIDNGEAVTPAQFFELMLRTWNYWRTGTRASKSLPIVNSLPPVIV